MFLFLLMASAMFTYLSSHLGWRVDCVITGSMEPALKAGSLVITKPAAADEVKVGDIITFHDNTSSDNTVTHRVIGIWKNSPIYFQTKGDANGSVDPFTVSARNLVGVVSFQLPYVGYFIYFLKTPLGFVTSIVVPTIILVLIYVKTVWQEIVQYKKRKAAGIIDR